MLYHETCLSHKVAPVAAVTTKPMLFDCYYQPQGTRTLAHTHPMIQALSKAKCFYALKRESDDALESLTWWTVLFHHTHWMPFIVWMMEERFGFRSSWSPFEDDVFWLTVLLSLSVFNSAFPFIHLPLIVSLAIKRHLFKRPAAALL